MRALNFDDLFVAVRVIDNSGLRDEVANLINSISTGKEKIDVRRVGIMGVLNALGVFAKPDTASAIYTFLAGPFEMDPESVRTLGLGELTKGLNYIAQEGGAKDFFKLLSGTLGQS